MGYFLFIRNKCLLLFVLTTLGCYVTDTSVSDDIKLQLQENKKEIESIKNSYLANEESSISKDYNFTEYDKRFTILKNKIDLNASQIIALKDSISIDSQLEVGTISSDQDIINSLIRIQSKLNIIEDKIFYSDSLYLNLLNDFDFINANQYKKTPYFEKIHQNNTVSICLRQNRFIEGKGNNNTQNKEKSNIFRDEQINYINKSINLRWDKLVKETNKIIYEISLENRDIEIVVKPKLNLSLIHI